MNFIQRNLKQTATIWEVGTTPDAYGNPTYAAPAKIKVRWESRIEKTLDSTGAEILSQAYVYMPAAYTPGDYIFLGVSTSATPPSDSFEVKNVQEIPNLRNTFSEHRAIL